MPQVASEAPVQSQSLSPGRVSPARSREANTGAPPFDSLIDDSPAAAPPPARDREAPSQTARQDRAQDKAEAPAKAPPERKASKPQQDAKTDKPTEKNEADGSNAKSETKADDEVPKADKTARPEDTDKAGKTDETVKLEPLPADGKEADKTAKKDETAETDDADKPDKATAAADTPPAPDPTAAQIAAQQAAANAQAQSQAQAPATTGAIVAAAAQTAATSDQADADGDNASPKAKAVLTALANVANTGGPAAKLSAQAEHAAQGTQPAQAPDTEEPTGQTAKAEPALEPEPDANSHQKIAEQKTIAAARGEKPANAPRATLPEASGNATATTQSTPAQTTTNAAQNITIPHPASQTAPQAAANAATQPAPQAPSAPVPLAGVAVAIAARASAGKNDFSIRLDPPELGRVDVRLSVDKDGHITSHLVADRRDTLALLQRDASGLQRALQDAGFKTGDNGLQFSLRDSFVGQQQQQQQQSNGGNAGHIVLNDETPGADAIPNGYGRYLGRVGGVDIRV